MCYGHQYREEMRAGVGRVRTIRSLVARNSRAKVVSEYRTVKLHGFSTQLVGQSLEPFSDVPSGLIPMAKIHAGNRPTSFRHIPKATNPYP